MLKGSGAALRRCAQQHAVATHAINKLDARLE